MIRSFLFASIASFIGIVACSSSDSTGTPPPAGGDASVPGTTVTAQSGTFTCELQCACAAGASCNITCSVGNACVIEVEKGATATIQGGGGGLQVTCDALASCTIMGAAGGSTTTCTDSTSCDTTCTSAHCDLTCSGTPHCKLNLNGGGTGTCTGCT